MTRGSIFDLSGKVALVTGAGGHLGPAYCEALAEFGADVACCDIDEPAAQRSAELIRKFGNRTLAIRADVTSPGDVEDMVNATVIELGSLDILLNNAGMHVTPCKLHELTLEAWDEVVDSHLRSVFLCMRAALPIMTKQKRGSIINISSAAVLRIVDPELFARPHFDVAKAGVISLTRTAAAEYAKDGIRINCIAPGYHGTASFDSSWSKEKVEKFESVMRSRVPMGRVGKPSDLKGLAIYLASEASSFVTGQIFVQDGGSTL